MDIEIQEMTGDALAVDLHVLKSQIIAEIRQTMELDARLERRRLDDRSLRTSALSRPQDLV